MPHKITDDCVSCGVCSEECPSKAISMGNDHFTIDAAACTDCGTCVEVCSSNAIEAK